MEMISYSFEVMKVLQQLFKRQFVPEQMAKR